VEYHEARYSRNGGDILLMPAAFGSHNWHPMAYSPKTNLVYLPTQEIPFGYADEKGFKYAPGLGRWNLGDASSQNAGPQSEAHRKALKAMTRGQLIAWDPVQQREVWRVQHSSVGAGGVLATAGNLVFQGMPDGRFIAYRADTGEKVWSFDGFNGIIAGAMSYRVGSDQYIAVLAGFGGSNGLHVPYIDNVSIGDNGRVLVFKLDRTATLPNNPRPILPVRRHFGQTVTMAAKSLLHRKPALRCFGVAQLLRKLAGKRKQRSSLRTIVGDIHNRGRSHYCYRQLQLTTMIKNGGTQCTDARHRPVYNCGETQLANFLKILTQRGECYLRCGCLTTFRIFQFRFNQRINHLFREEGREQLSCSRRRQIEHGSRPDSGVVPMGGFLNAHNCRSVGAPDRDECSEPNLG
jgi:hypothetical protein